MAIDAKEMWKKYGNLFRYTRQILLKICPAVVGNQKDELPVRIVMYHYARAIKLLAAVRIICMKGYATEASILLRSLLNLCINLKWLTLKDSKRRMKKFADYEIVVLHNTMKKALKHGGPSKSRTAKVQQVGKQAKAIKRKYESGDEWHPYFWSGKYISEMAKDVSMLDQYDLVYRQLSEREHTSPAAVRDFLEISASGGIRLKVGQSYEGIPMVLLSTLDYFLQTIGAGIEIVQLHGLDFVAEYKQFQKLHLKYFPE